MSRAVEKDSNRQQAAETLEVIARGFESPRDRVLVDPEMAPLKSLWRSGRRQTTSTFSDIVQLLILTGRRRSEIGGLQWAELNDDLTRIKLPAHRTKNGRSHLVPLS